MRVLAIDQSYTSSGIVILDDGVLTHAELFQTDPTKDIFQRAWDAAIHMKSVADVYKPNHIVMEGLAFSKFGNATRDLAGLQFAIVTVLRFVEGYDLVVIAPNSVKKTATGGGKATKPEMYDKMPDEVKKYFISLGAKKTKGLYDLSDAYWIGQAGIIEIGKKDANIRI